MARRTIGIFDLSTNVSGPSRYVQTILDGLDPAEFEAVMYCAANSVYRERPGVRLCPVQAAKAPAPSANGAATHAVNAKPSLPSHPTLKARMLGWTPKPARVVHGFWREARRLARIFREHPVDLFHTNCAGCEESPVAARLAGLPRRLATFHVDSTYDLFHERSDLGHRLLEWWSNRSLDRAIAVSEATKQDWLRRTGIAETRVETIWNGIDPALFQRERDRLTARRHLGLPGDDRLVVGGIGRLDHAKGFAYLIDAAAELIKEFPQLLVAIAGGGPLHDELQRKIDQHGLGAQVRLLGFRQNVQEIYDALDVFVLSSLCEALPYVVMEAMAHELPIVGTTVGGVAEMIVPNATGCLVPPRDPTALARALRPLLQSAEVRTAFGRAGRERVERHFHVRDSVRRTIELYRKMLAIDP